MQRFPGLLLGLAMAAAAGPAAANDSTAALGAGGLVLTDNDAVAIVSEDLTLSTEEIRVRYEFRNETAADVETLVAFPLPRMEMATLYEVPVDSPTADPVNFVGFRVWVDGQEVMPELEMTAHVGKADVTETLVEHGVPLSLFDPHFFKRLQTLPEASKQALAATGAIVADEYGTYPQWTTEAAFYWPQRFPAGRTVVVEHRYQPVVGQSFFSTWQADELGPGDPYTEAFCIDDGTARAIRGLLDRQADEYALLLSYEIHYILTTANNWRGPIGTFHLTLDKGEPENIVSLCIDDIEKTGPTTFEATYTDWTPTRDLQVLILAPPQP